MVSTEAGGPKPMHMNALNEFMTVQPSFRIVVKLTRANDVNFESALRETPGQIVEQLARGRNVGKEVAIDEDQPLPLKIHPAMLRVGYERRVTANGNVVPNFFVL